MRTPSQYQQIEDLFHAALERAPTERSDFLRQACQGNESLRRQVESLLKADGQVSEWLDIEVREGASQSFPPSPSLLLAGSRVGHYQVLLLLGVGGMSEVYLAEDTKLARKVALKLLPAQFNQDRERLQRFEREARAASALNHPNIITLYECGQAGDLHYLITEFVEGETLRERLARGCLSLTEALPIIQQIAAALAATHEAGIIHRDIKPENVMLRKDGLVKVLDFGLAKFSALTPVACAWETVTEVGRALGTIHYMSPEQALGKKIDARTDIFSLGIIFYELLTGKAPFQASTPAASYDALLNKAHAPMRKYNPALPAELETILSQMLRKDCAARYQSIADVQADLERLQKRLGTKAGRWRTAQWRWYAALVLSGLLLVLVTGGLWLRLGKPSTRDFRRTDWRPQQPFFEQVDLFTRTDNSFNPHRIPALAVTKAGTLLAVIDVRKYANPTTIELVLRRSTDAGRTWGPVTSLQKLPAGQQAHEASLLVDRHTGRIFCFYMQNLPGIGVGNSQPGSNDTADSRTVHAHLIHSDDDGVTWNTATPLDLNPQLKDPNWKSFYATSGHGIQTRSGRLMQPFGVIPSVGLNAAIVAYSDDHGATWKRGQVIGNDIFDPKLVELEDGALLLNARGTTRDRATMRSTDGGISFAPMSHDPTLVGARCNGDILRYAARRDGAPQNMLLFSNPAHLHWRMRMTVRLSHDEGRTWPIAKVVHRGPAGYSTMAVLPDGTIGLLYERSVNFAEQDIRSPINYNVERITFARFNLEWLHATDPVLSETGTPNVEHGDLWAWLDAGNNASLNGPGTDRPGDLVRQWDDLAPPFLHSLRQATSAPGSLLANAVNGLSAIRFAAGQSLASPSDAKLEFGTLPNGFTLLLVARVNGVTGQGYLFDSAVGTGVGLQASLSQWFVHAGRILEGPNHVFKSGPLQRGVFQLHTLRLDSAQIEHYVNGELAIRGTVNDGGIPLHQWGLTLNANYSGQRSAASDFAELLGYSRALSEAERRTLENYLLQKYALKP